MTQLEVFNKDQLHAFTEHQTLLFGSFEKPLILQAANGALSKAFYPPTKLSRSRWFPKGIRFADNGIKLQALDLNAPYPKRLIHCPDKAIHIVSYKKLPGTDLRHLVGEKLTLAFERLATYLAELHQKGISFKAIHLGNVLLMPKAEMGLVDTADLKVFPKPLSLLRRYKNLVHLFKKTDDETAFTAFGHSRFLDHYGRAAVLNTSSLCLLRSGLRQRLGNTDL